MIYRRTGLPYGISYLSVSAAFFNHRLKLFFGQDRDSQFCRLLQLAAGILACDNVAGLFRDRTGRFAAERLDQIVDLLAGIERQAAGCHNGLSGEQVALCGLFHR